MLPQYMFVILPVLVLFSCVSAICIVTYCKTRSLERNGTPLNNEVPPRDQVNARSGESGTSTAIFIVPTTSQVMEIFMNQANASNNTESPTICRPPSYGTLVIDIPPSYEQAIQRVEDSAK